jgi:radical SAM protein with 4Fe4S-binding SPASM domain
MFPDHVDIESTNACQMKCPMCFQNALDVRNGFMDFALYRKIVDECARLSVFSIRLSWRGEALLHPSIVEMVSYAKGRGIKNVSFLTNVERLDEKLAAGLIKSGLDYLAISFDGWGETYERIRKPAKFQESMEKVTMLHSLRRKMGREKPLLRLQTIRSAIAGDPAVYKKMWEGIADKIMVISDQDRAASDEDKTFRQDPDYICPYPWQRMTIIWDGRVLQCIGDEYEENEVGNANHESLLDIWRGEKMKRVRELHKRRKRMDLPPCRKCEMGGVVETEEISIEGRKIKTKIYTGQAPASQGRE